jgi:soluble lytic murein transglycosylase-like protein
MEAKLGYTPGQERPETHFADNLAGLGAVVGTAYGEQKDHALEEAKLDIASNNGLRTEERPFWSPVTDQDLTNLEVAHGADALKAQNHIDMVNHIDKSPEQYKQHLASMGKTASASSQNPEWFAKRFNADTEELTQAQENLHYHYNAEKQVALMTNLLGLPLVELQQSIMTLPPGTDTSVKEAMQKRTLDVLATRLNDPPHSNAAHLALHSMVTQGLATGDPTMYNAVQQMVKSGLTPKENLDSIPDLGIAKEKYKQTSGNQLSALQAAILQAQTQNRTEDVTRLTAQYAQLATVIKSTGIQLEPYAQSILDSEFNSLSYNKDKVQEQNMMQEQEHAHTAIAQQEHFLKKAGEARINGDDKDAANYEQLAAQSNQVYNERTKLNPAVAKTDPYISKYNVDNDKGPALDPLLIKAVIQQESGGNTNAISSAGATGAMQLMPATAARFGVTDRKDPDQNIRGGIEYLKFLNKKFNGNIDLILAGYNAGENAVEKHHNTVPPYRETQDYVRSIKAIYQNLQNTTEASDTVNNHFANTKDSVAASVALAQYSDTNADTINALRAGTLSSAQILELSPKLKASLDSGNFPEKAKAKLKTDVVKLLASATHKAVTGDVTTLTEQMQNGDAQGAEETMQTILAVAKGGNFQYTQSPAVVKALNAGIETVTKSGRVEDAIALQQKLQELAPDSSFDDNARVISQGQADARKPAWISQREKSFQDNLPAIEHALGGPRKITSQRDAYEALLPDEQKHILDDVNTADYYSTVLQVPGVDKNRLHQIYSLISGRPSSTRVKAILSPSPLSKELAVGQDTPDELAYNATLQKAFLAQEKTANGTSESGEQQSDAASNLSPLNITETGVSRVKAQGKSVLLGEVLESFVQANQQGIMRLTPTSTENLRKILRPDVHFDENGKPSIRTVLPVGNKNPEDYEKMQDTAAIIASAGKVVRFSTAGGAPVNENGETNNYDLNGKQGNYKSFALQQPQMRNLTRADQGEFMRMWEVGKNIMGAPLTQFSLTWAAFEARTPHTAKGWNVRGSTGDNTKTGTEALGAVGKLNKYLASSGTAIKTIDDLLQSPQVQDRIQERLGTDETNKYVGKDLSWYVTPDLTLEAYVPDDVNTRPLQITQADGWNAAMVKENQTLFSVPKILPDEPVPGGAGNYGHEVLKNIATGYRDQFGKVERILDAKPLDEAHQNLAALKLLLGVTAVGTNVVKDTSSFVHDLAVGAPPIKNAEPPKELQR